MHKERSLPNFGRVVRTTKMKKDEGEGIALEVGYSISSLLDTEQKRTRNARCRLLAGWSDRSKAFLIQKTHCGLNMVGW